MHDKASVIKQPMPGSGLSDGHALAETYRARFPKARVAEYPESGHSPFAEAAERFNADLEAFVSGISR